MTAVLMTEYQVQIRKEPALTK